MTNDYVCKNRVRCSFIYLTHCDFLRLRGILLFYVPIATVVRHICRLLMWMRLFVLLCSSSCCSFRPSYEPQRAFGCLLACSHAGNENKAKRKKGMVVERRGARKKKMRTQARAVEGRKGFVICHTFVSTVPTFFLFSTTRGGVHIFFGTLPFSATECCAWKRAFRPVL